jgi:putative oxidoreductase
MAHRASVISLIGRVMIAALFIISGISKLGDTGGIQGYIASVGLPMPQLGYAVALIVEIGVGLLLLVGGWTRISAAILVGFCLVTAFFFHRNFADHMQMILFIKNMMITGGLLQFVANGAGPISLDAQRARAPVAAP